MLNSNSKDKCLIQNTRLDFGTDKRYKDIHDNNTVYCKQTNENYCRVDLDRPAQKFLKLVQIQEQNYSYSQLNRQTE